jgi:hypothetical protein
MQNYIYLGPVTMIQKDEYKFLMAAMLLFCIEQKNLPWQNLYILHRSSITQNFNSYIKLWYS